MASKISFVELLLFSSLMITLVEKSAQQECEVSSERKIDGVMARLLTIGNSGRKFPESKGEELKRYCDDSKTYITQVENYKNKCLKDLPKQVTGVIVYSVKNAMNQLCKKDSKRLTELIDSSSCLNKGTDDFNKCYSKYIDAVLGAKNAVDKKKIPHNCCEYFKMFSCVENRLIKIKSCSEKQIETALNFVRSLFGNVIDLICNEYTEGSDKCQKLESVPKKNKTQRRTKSFLIPLIDLLSSTEA